MPESADGVAALTVELQTLRRGHGLREPSKLAITPTLARLARVIRRREVDDPTDPNLDAKGVLLDAIGELTGQSLRIASAAFGIGVGNEAPTLTGRRVDVARALEIDVKTVIRREDRLMRTLAHLLVERAHEAHLRDSHSKLERRQPVAESLAVDWLERFRHYYRMWSDLQGVANDFETYLYRRVQDSGDPEIDSYPRSSLGYFARFLVHLERFAEDEGGLWLLSDADAEVAVADAINRITWHPPTGDPDQSWLRTAMRTAPEGELIGFLHAVDTSEVGQEIFGRWERWLARCDCQVEQPAPGCEVHQMIGLCLFYCETMDREWYRIADWYRLPPEQLGSQVTPAPALLRQFPYRLDELKEDGP